MDLVLNGNKQRKIVGKEDIPFSLEVSGLYLIEVTARTQGEKQLGMSDDEDLRVEIDGRKFPQLKNPQRYFDSPASFSGGSLHGLKKTVFFILLLDSGEHTISLISDISAIVEQIKVSQVSNAENSQVNLLRDITAEDGDRRDWITFVLDNIPLKEISVTITYSRRKGDSDDVRIKIDGQIQWNIFRDIKNFLWYFAGSLIPLISPTRTETQVFTTNFSTGLHYIELDADRMPTLEKVILNFGSKLPIPKRIPTVNDPKWTGNFDDDTDEILLARLIFGEAENQSKETKIWIAGSVLNRVKATAWPNTIHEVIRQTDQYDPFKPEDPNYPKVIDPLNSADEIRINAWRQSYEVARGILSGEIENPTKATHFHGIGISKDRFIKQIVPNGRFIRQIDDTYFYWSLN